MEEALWAGTLAEEMVNGKPMVTWALPIDSLDGSRVREAESDLQ